MKQSLARRADGWSNTPLRDEKILGHEWKTVSAVSERRHRFLLRFIQVDSETPLQSSAGFPATTRRAAAPPGDVTATREDLHRRCRSLEASASATLN